MIDLITRDSIGLLINKFLLFIMALIIITEIVYIFSPLQRKKKIELFDHSILSYSYSFKIAIGSILMTLVLYFLCEPQLSRDISIFSLIMISAASLTINHMIQSNQEKRDLKRKMERMIKGHAKSTSIMKDTKNLKIEDVIEQLKNQEEKVAVVEP